MASLLRQIVAGPRSRHSETGLDLCYVTENSTTAHLWRKFVQGFRANVRAVIATSGPSSTYPQRAYRNPTDVLVKFLDYKHGKDWAIWEFRAEGTGYPDSEVYDRIRHYPWPDHHPPPFALIPNLMASMRDWLKDPRAGKDRVVVVHCKAGKGRSGTVACSYLISQEGWTVADALTRFTERRMRSGFGNGVSIPSQLRWIGYVDWWSKHGKTYVEREVEILEVHVWGLRDGVKVAVQGYIEEGKILKTFHTFARHERVGTDSVVMNGPSPTPSFDRANGKPLPVHESKAQFHKSSTTDKGESTSTSEPGASIVMFRPAQPVILPTSDINIDFERRNKASYGFAMVTSVAHVWFNTFFESQHSSTPSHDFMGPSPYTTDTPSNSNVPDNGVFDIAWEAMDGIKGSARKGTRALDRLAVVWRAVPDQGEGLITVIREPAMGEHVPDLKSADWTKANQEDISTLGKDLGLRIDSPSSAEVSRASSMADLVAAPSKTSDISAISVRSHIPIPVEERRTKHADHPIVSISEPNPHPNAISDDPNVDGGLEKMQSPCHSPAIVGDRTGVVDVLKAISTEDLKTAEEHLRGQVVEGNALLNS